MNVNRQTKQSRTFRLSNYTISTLQRLSTRFCTSMTQIVEIAVSRLDCIDKSQEYLIETVNYKKGINDDNQRETREER